MAFNFFYLFFFKRHLEFANFSIVTISGTNIEVLEPLSHNNGHLDAIHCEYGALDHSFPPSTWIQIYTRIHNVRIVTQSGVLPDEKFKTLPICAI